MGDRPDHLRLKGMRFWGRHGHLLQERELGNRFEVDVDLQLDVSRAAELDRIDLTVDLTQVYEIVRTQIEDQPCGLLETLTERIAQAITALEKIHSVTVCVRKLMPPFPGATDGVMEVEITRSIP